ncbi:ATP synthase subunit I [Desulforamulus aquiferis]|uniref:ATP synthase subunit I n=1 Tax=Desulforamulus aquiferis TaxID=1397668 RepID=A0AAW7ZAX2_9FIRM|nr:ATP synthase subunit I [Desulforamulus aquiferis]MDO7786827.1 ATP synthase subunit I [Desulforamulus aquiferis]
MLGTEIRVEDQYMRTVRSTALVVIAVAIMLIMDFQNPVYRGLFIGSLVSLQNVVILSRNIKKIAQITDTRQAIPYVNRGFFFRLIIIMATLWLSIRIPSISVHAAAVGLFVAPALSITDLLIRVIKERVLHQSLSR